MSQTEDPIPEPSEAPSQAVVTDPAPAAAQMPQAPARRGGGLLGGLIGGVLAAGLGFGAARLYPDGWPLAVTGDLTAKLDQQAKDIQALRDEVTRLSQAGDAGDDLAQRIAGLEAKTPPTVDLSPVETRISDLESRLSAIEALPKDGSAASPAAIAALQAEVQALKSGGTGTQALQDLSQQTEAALTAAEERAAALQAETEAMVAKARARTALGQVMAAMDSGAPYAGLLPDLGPDPAGLPQALTDPATAGISTMAQLRDAFPEAARAALEASLQADMGATWSDRIGSFLRAQTGARSLEPREGSDPDAVLSRAEARLAEGDLAAALTQLDALPEAGKAAMAPWRTRAEARLAAIAALAALSSQIDG